MSGLIGKKIGMTSIYDENGKNLPCTVIEAGTSVDNQVKSTELIEFILSVPSSSGVW